METQLLTVMDYLSAAGSNSNQCQENQPKNWCYAPLSLSVSLQHVSSRLFCVDVYSSNRSLHAAYVRTANNTCSS